VSDLRETVARAIFDSDPRYDCLFDDDDRLMQTHLRYADAAIGSLLERLLAETETFLWSVVEDQDGRTVPVDDWLRAKLDGSAR